MVRPITFDHEVVSERAMQVFWDNGIKTSLKHIETGTGLNRSSLYNTFGNKEKIFELCMDRYMCFLSDGLAAHFSKNTFKNAITLLFDDAINDNFNGRGCMFFNFLVHPDKLNKTSNRIIDAAYKRLHAQFELIIAEAQKNREINSVHTSAGYAAYLLTCLSGFRAFNMAGISRVQLKLASEVTLKTLIQ